MTVRRRIFVGLEERDGKAANKGRCETRVFWHTEKPFQERESGCFHGKEHAQPFLLLVPEQPQQEGKLFLCNKEAFTEPFYRSNVQEILCQNAEEEEKAGRSAVQAGNQP